MRKFILLFCLLLSGVAILPAQIRPVTSGAVYPYLISLPHDSILQNNPPLLIFLHGRSLSGTDLNLVKKYGVMREIERGRKIPAVVAAPQIKPGQNWEPAKVLAFIDQIQAKHHTDSSRVYVVGMSLGGYGTLHFAGKYPERVAGAVALCGGGNTSDCCRLASIPLWIEHGRLDKAVPISESEKIVAGIQACNGGKLLHYAWHDNWDHGDPYVVFGDDRMYKWLFSQRK